ncbi:MAG: site-2 protease family protein [Oscillospiraceae bacterium]|nr:site-2 protease family protein [Oscillospiraceae bacterium]
MVTLIVTIIMFLVMVSLHEFGHFAVGKLLDFKILEYSIGFGPAIFSRQWGETKYSLRAVPLGGYCKFEGEDTKSEDSRAFSNRAVWKRILVVAAGGIMNVILGFLIFIVIVFATSPILTNTIETVVEHSYIEDAGILPGDEIIKINGKNVNFYDDITLYTSDFTKDTDAQITVKRGGEKLEFTIRPTEQIITYTYGEDGIEVSSAVNGYEETELVPYSDENPKDDSMIGEVQTSTRYIIGFSPRREDVTVFNVWGQAWNETKFVVKLVYRSLWEMVTGKIGVDQMSGPVGIVSEGNSAVT